MNFDGPIDPAKSAEYASLESLRADGATTEKRLGLQADTLAFRNLSDHIRVAFKNPDETDNAWVTIESGDAPFVLSGVHGIETTVIWYKQAPTAGGPSDFDVLAVGNTTED
jgi:hypothetical protein